MDISPVMLEQARQFNRKGERCQYVWNSAPDLRIFPDGYFDFIYSRITLQHIPPPRVQSYLKEFLRVLMRREACDVPTARPLRESVPGNGGADGEPVGADLEPDAGPGGDVYERD